MSCDCCTQQTTLGCFAQCEDFDTELIPPAGDYTIELEFNGRTITKSATLDGAASLEVPRSWVNEDYDHLMQIIDENGDPWVDGDGNDCFLIQVKPIIL